VSGFKFAPSKFAVARSSFAVSMGTPAGVNMKPQFDDTFKEAGAHRRGGIGGRERPCVVRRVCVAFRVASA